MARREVPSNPPGTSGLRRDPALVPLSRDHHHSLVQAFALRRAGEAAREDEARPAAVAFLDHFREAMAGHFEDEEEVLLPAAAAADPSGVQRVREEHEELRAGVAELERALTEGRDTRAIGADLGRRIDDHVRYEERAFFGSLQRALGGEGLAALGQALEVRRAARGLAAGCPLPRST